MAACPAIVFTGLITSVPHSVTVTSGHLRSYKFLNILATEVSDMRIMKALKSLAVLSFCSQVIDKTITLPTMRMEWKMIVSQWKAKEVFLILKLLKAFCLTMKGS